MKSKAAADAHKVTETGEPPEQGYDSWKRKKVERGVAEAADRDGLIPGDQVWRDLGLER